MMQFPGSEKGPVGIVFDTDMRAIDAALGLALLYGFDGKNEARVASVSVSVHNLNAAAFCDAVGRFYAGAPITGPFAGFSRALPVGLSTDGAAKPDLPMVTAPLAKRNPDGAPAYTTVVKDLNDTAEVAALIRNAFTAQFDQNCIAVLAGPATNLVKVLDLPGAKDLIAHKVRFLAMAGGAYPNGAPEGGIRTDIAAARKLFAEWPTPIVASGYEVGAALPFPAASVEKDFAWSPAHPIADAYRANKPMPYDAPTWDMAALLYAVRPKEGYFKLSDAGTISVLDDGRTKFTASPDGKHRYLILDPAKKDSIVKVYAEVASAKPVPRIPRFRLKQDVPVKAPDAKPTP